MEGGLLLVEVALHLAVIPVAPPDAADDAGGDAREQPERHPGQCRQDRRTHRSAARATSALQRSTGRPRLTQKFRTAPGFLLALPRTHAAFSD